MQLPLRSECPSRKPPPAVDPKKIPQSRFAAANSFSRFTSSVSFVSVECISNPFLSSSATSFLKRLLLRCCRRQILQTRRHLRHRQSLRRPSRRLPNHLPSAFRYCLPAFPAETTANRLRPIRLLLRQIGFQ